MFSRNAGEPGQAPVRLLNRNGKFNIEPTGMARQFDVYHSLLSMTWLRFLAFMFTAYFTINLAFAGAYFLCGPQGLQGSASPEDFGGRFMMCFFFSVHTLATIGYGTIAPSNFAANVLVTFEAFVGLAGLALGTGLLFARFSRPTARVIFSDKALFTRRQGLPTLSFRIANARRNQIVRAEVAAVVAFTETTLEGQNSWNFRDLKLRRSVSPFFALSWLVVHVIDEESPFFGLSMEQLEKLEAEVIVSLTGIDDTFSQLVHARYSYALNEIVRDKNFSDMLVRTPKNNIRIDLSQINRLEEPSAGA